MQAMKKEVGWLNGLLVRHQEFHSGYVNGSERSSDQEEVMTWGPEKRHSYMPLKGRVLREPFEL